MNEVLRKLDTEFILNDLGNHGRFPGSATLAPALHRYGLSFTGIASALLGNSVNKGSIGFGLEDVAGVQRAL